MLITWDNFPNAEYLLMELLCLDPPSAQRGASRLRDHLKDLRSDAMTAFEKEFADNLRLMHQIDLFSNCAPPVLLHHHSLCHELFEYAADRCLACQDVFLYAQHNDTYIATASRPRADLFFSWRSQGGRRRRMARVCASLDGSAPG